MVNECKLIYLLPSRINFITRCLATQVLVDAVMFGVIPIVYEYEGTTLESLMSQLEMCLQGRSAK